LEGQDINKVKLITLEHEWYKQICLRLDNIFYSKKDFEFSYLRDANGNLVWVDISAIDGVRTFTYYDSPGGSIVSPVHPLVPVSLGVDTELIEDKYIAVATDLTNGYSIGDQLSKISYFEITTINPVLVSTFWFNKTTNTILTTVDIMDLEDQDGPIITTPGTGGLQITVDGTHPFSFDADSFCIKNLTPNTITVQIDGVLGGNFFIPTNTAEEIEYDVAKATGVIISGITSGEVLVTYNRGK
jgi:hypothetical protein